MSKKEGGGFEGPKWQSSKSPEEITRLNREAMRARGTPEQGREPVSDTEAENDPQAFERVAVDMQWRMEDVIRQRPEWHVTLTEVDAAKREWLDRGQRYGLKVLEDDIEETMREDAIERDGVIRHLSLALAYLELSDRPHEEGLDLRSE